MEELTAPTKGRLAAGLQRLLVNYGEMEGLQSDLK